MQNDKIFDKYISTLGKQETMNGLLLAQVICSRRMLDAFDKNQQDIVILIMQDIVETIENIRGTNESE